MELIKVNKNENNEQVVSARELHSFLEIKKDFSDWIKTYVGNEIYGFEKNLDYTTFDMNTSSKLLGYEGMGERNLFKFMRSNKWINLNNTPSQIMVAKGRAISVLKHNRHMNVDYHQTRLTIKGLFWVGNKLREAGYETFVTDDMLVRQIEELMTPSEIVDSNN